MNIRQSFFFVVVLAAISLLVSSCGGSDRAADTMAVADSMMMTRPRAALDMLCSMDSSTFSRFGRKDLAFYTLLMTEAKYKCYHPVSNDTAIFQVAGYYADRGPESRYVRALMMVGAVYMERGEPVPALEAFKEAEPLMERAGDWEQLGLLNTRMGELYQLSFTDIPSTVYRYRRAVLCFERGGVTDRLASAYLTLSRALLPEADSAAVWKAFYTKGMEYAKAAGNISLVVGAMNQNARYQELIEKDYQEAKSISLEALRSYPEYCSLNYRRDFLSVISESYVKLGMPDSAKVYVDMIPVGDAVSRMIRYRLYAYVAESMSDWEQAYRNNKAYNILQDSISNAGKNDFLSMREQALEIRYSKLEYKYKKQRLQAVILIVVACAAVLGLLAAVSITRLHTLRSKIRGVLNKMKTAVARTHVSETADDIDVLSEYLDMVVRQQGGDDRLRGFVKTQLSLLNGILDKYFIYESGDLLRASLSELFDGRLHKEDTKGMVLQAVEVLYPGFMDYLKAIYGFTDTDLYYISLLLCGFSNNSQQVLTGNKIGTIYVARSRTASKTGKNIMLSRLIVQELKNYTSRKKKIS